MKWADCIQHVETYTAPCGRRPISRSGILRSFSEGYAYWQKLVLRNVVQYIYNCGKKGMPLAMLGIGYLSAFSQICTFIVISFGLESWISPIDISHPFFYNTLRK